MLRAVATYYCVTDADDGEVLLRECFDRDEAIAFARKDDGERIVWAHGRDPRIVGPCRWRVYQ